MAQYYAGLPKKGKTTTVPVVLPIEDYVYSTNKNVLTLVQIFVRIQNIQELEASTGILSYWSFIVAYAKLPWPSISFKKSSA